MAKPQGQRKSGYQIPPRPLICKAFGRILTVSTAAAGAHMAEESRQQRSTWRHFLDYVGLGMLPRAPPSSGDPSILVGTRVDTEEDVLHVRHLPDFGGNLNARDAELMLSYLTAPYIRTPLILRFFSDHARLRALSSPELRDVLDACLFEPGLWCPPTGTDAPSSAIPAPDRCALATPCGLLFNELRCAPVGLIGALDALFDNAPHCVDMIVSMRLMRHALSL